MYTLTSIANVTAGPAEFGSIIFLGVLLATLLWLILIVMLDGPVPPSNYRILYFGLVVILCFMIYGYASVIRVTKLKNAKIENIPVEATYVTHIALQDSNLFRITFKLEDGTIVQAEPHNSVPPQDKPVTLYWNKP
jgi:hypothetical protein